MVTKRRTSPPGSIHKLTHRTTTGEFAFRPDEQMNENLLYLLGYMQLIYVIRLHLAGAMSNHIHLLLTDVLGDQLQRFNTHFFSLLTRSTNALRGRDGNLLDPKGVNCVHVCPRAEDIIANGVYISMNPSRQGSSPRRRSGPA